MSLATKTALIRPRRAGTPQRPEGHGGQRAMDKESRDHDRRGAPPRADEALAAAIELLAAGAWQPAHEIVQREKSSLAAWLHGIVHTIEGDLDNARYWYQKAGRVFPGADGAAEEIVAALRALANPARGDAPGA